MKAKFTVPRQGIVGRAVGTGPCGRGLDPWMAGSAAKSPPGAQKAAQAAYDAMPDKSPKLVKRTANRLARRGRFPKTKPRKTNDAAQYGKPEQRRAVLKRKPQAPTPPRVTKPKRLKLQPRRLRFSYSDLLLLRKCLNEAMSHDDLTDRQRERLTGIIAQINSELAEQRR
jgi:hypothetical protein